MLKGFREFILRGNVVDLAVAVVVGAAFNNIVSSLVKDIATPLVGAVIKTSDFSNLAFTLNGSRLLYGDFLNSLVSFLVVATAVYFFVLTPLNKLNARLHKGTPAGVMKKCTECLSDIPAKAKRCAYCGQPVK